jgi:CRP/FNR family transcriptional regulator
VIEVARLREVPLFAALDDDALDALVRRCHTIELEAGRQIVSAGQAATAFFVVLAGRVKVYKLSARGDEQILHHYGPGQTFGEAAVLSKTPFPAFAETLEHARLLEVTRAALTETIAAEPELALAMLGGLSAKLREFARLIEQLSLKEVPARLADVLLELSERAGSETFVLAQSKRQLAAQIGTVAETMSRALKKLRAERLIEVDGATITILDAERLRELAETDS